MRSTAPLILLLLLLPAVEAEEVWIFLDDGRVGRGDVAGDPVVVTLPDGSAIESSSDKIVETRTDRQMTAAIDAMMKDLGKGRRIDKHADRLKSYQAAAVPRLIDHLQGKKPVNRANALWAFCHAWSQRAIGPVADCLDDSDPAIRRASLVALSRHVPPERLNVLLRRIVNHADPRIAVFGFETAERIAPDLKRIKKFLAEPGCWEHLVRYLPRYQSPDLIPLVRSMLAKGKGEVQRTAVVSLTILCDNADATREKMLTLLVNAAPEVREVIGEYFSCLGRKSDLPALEKQAARERDLFARASLLAAVEAIRRRGGRLTGAAPGAEAPLLPESGEPSRLYADALDLLQRSGDQETWNLCFEIFRNAEPFEPRYVYRGNMPPQSFQERIRNRIALQAALFAFPCSPASGEREFLGRAEPPEADRLQPPIRDYFDRARKSYGKLVDSRAKVFGNTVHVGDDTGWHRDLLAVTAIGNGIVRRVDSTFSWGGIVIIEHQGTDGNRYCSLYAHLSPHLLVRPGERVERGRKIGSIGRTHTWENGGFNGHIHFGIHEGPYIVRRRPGDRFETRMNGRPERLTVVEVRETSVLCRLESGTLVVLHDSPGWVGGYLAPAVFEEGRHGWVDPQVFIRKRRKP